MEMDGEADVILLKELRKRLKLVEEKCLIKWRVEISEKTSFKLHRPCE